MESLGSHVFESHLYGASWLSHTLSLPNNSMKCTCAELILFSWAAALGSSFASPGPGRLSIGPLEISAASSRTVDSLLQPQAGSSENKFLPTTIPLSRGPPGFQAFALWFNALEISMVRILDQVLGNKQYFPFITD